jgi:hypothetical protein
MSAVPFNLSNVFNDFNVFNLSCVKKEGTPSGAIPFLPEWSETVGVFLLFLQATPKTENRIRLTKGMQRA